MNDFGLLTRFVPEESAVLALKQILDHCLHKNAKTTTIDRHWIMFLPFDLDRCREAELAAKKSTGPVVFVFNLKMRSRP